MKYCIECDCIMPDDHDGDMCEICQDERGNTIPGSLRKEIKNNVKSVEFVLRYRSI